MYLHFYLRDGIVYLPTVGKMGEGFYRDVEPVAMIEVSHTEALRSELAGAIARGNPKISLLRRSEWQAPVVLKYAGVRSWPAFERGLIWGLEEQNGVFKIIGKTKKPDGARIDDPAQTTVFPAGTTANDVVQRMIAILQNAAHKQ